MISPLSSKTVAHKHSYAFVDTNIDTSSYSDVVDDDDNDIPELEEFEDEEDEEEETCFAAEEFN